MKLPDSKNTLFFLKVFIYILSLFGVVAGGIALMQYHMYRNSEKNSLIRDERKVLSYEKLIIDEHIKALEKDMEYLADLRRTIGYVRSMYDPKYDPTVIFKSFLERRKVYSCVRIIDSSGREVLRIDYRGGTAVKADKDSLQEKGQRYYFNEMINGPLNRVTFSKFDYNYENGRIELPPRPVVRIGKVITDAHGSRKAIVVLNYNGENLFNTIYKANFYNEGLLYFINCEGEILSRENPSSPDNPVVEKFIAGEKWREASSMSEGYIDGDIGLVFFNKFHFPGSSAERNCVLMSYVDSGRLAAFYTSAKKKSLYMFLILLGFSFLPSVLVAMYMSKRKSMRDELLILRTAVSQSANSIVITDPGGSIKFANKAFEILTGYTLEELAGENPRVLKSGYHNRNFYENLWKTIKSGKVWKGVFLNRKKDGTTFWEKATISPVEDSKKRIRYYIAVKEDISENKRIENELKVEREQLELSKIDAELAREEAEKANQLKSAFLANISHEIRTPMNAILGFANILLSNETDKDKIEKLRIIIESGDYLLKLINDILDLSKIEAGGIDVVPAKMSIRDVAESVCKLLKGRAEAKGLELTLSVSEDVPRFIIGDENLIRHILINIVSNAVKFTSEGSVKIEISQNDGILDIAVTDTGIGIPEDKLDFIFEPFKQQDSSTSRRYGGTGLGLAISKKYAELMGGGISVTSTPGKGTTFVCSLPYDPASGSSEGNYESGKGGKLVEIWRERLEGNNGFMVDILYDTLEKLPQQISSLYSAVSKGDYTQAKKITHTLKGSTGNLKMYEVYDKLKKIEALLSGNGDNGKEITALAGELLNMAESIRVSGFRREKLSGGIEELEAVKTPDSGLKILAADDDESNRKVIEAFLKYSGMKADFAEDGEQVLEKLEAERYDVLLIDIQMPVLDGIETMARIRKDGRNKDLYVIAVTGSECGSDDGRLEEAGFDDCVSKPLDMELLIDKIRKAGPENSYDWIVKELEPCVEAFNADRILKVADKIDSVFSGGNEDIAARIREIAGSYNTDALLKLLEELKRKIDAGQ